jgi:hypothetical protein
MPILTIEAIQQNPRNVISHDLPAYPSQELLRVAQFAAACCRQIESEILDLADEPGSTLALSPEAKNSVDRFLIANRKIGEICATLEKRFGVPFCDFWLFRNST